MCLIDGIFNQGEFLPIPERLEPLTAVYWARPTLRGRCAKKFRLGGIGNLGEVRGSEAHNMLLHTARCLQRYFGTNDGIALVV